MSVCHRFSDFEVNFIIENGVLLYIVIYAVAVVFAIIVFLFLYIAYSNYGFIIHELIKF